MIALLIVGLAWLGLLTFVVAALHVCTSTPTPRAAAETALTLTGQELELAERSTRTDQSAPRPALLVNAA